MRPLEFGEDQLTPAILFDAFTGGRYSWLTSRLGEHVSVVGTPGEQPVTAPAPGDLLVTRALGEGRLAWVEVISEDTPTNFLDQHGRVRRDSLLLRPAPPVITVPPVNIGSQPDLSVRCVPPPTVLDRFIKDSAALTAAHRSAIDSLAARIVSSQSGRRPVHLICVVGHTDTSGDASYNLALGRRRADNVRAALTSAIDSRSPGLGAHLVIEASSLGETSTVAPDTTLDGQARNRRVEVFLNDRWLSTTTGARAAITAPRQSGSTLREEELAENIGPFHLVAAPGTEWTMEGTGEPLPPGTPGFTWTTSDPSVLTVANRNGDTQASPNTCVIRLIKPGTANITLTYRTKANKTATVTKAFLVAKASVTALSLAPTAAPNPTGPNALRRPAPVANLRTDPATRNATITLEPASVFGGKEIVIRFRDSGAVRGALPAAHATRLEAVAGSVFNVTTGRAALSAAGSVEVRINMPAVAFNGGSLEFESVDAASVKGSLRFEVPGHATLDPGHGGTATVGGSSPNNATSVTGVLEKNMTLDMMNRVSTALMNNGRHMMEVSMTRTADVNVGIAARAAVADTNGADVLFVLHFNGVANAATRGVETFFRETATNGNVNEAEDRAFAQRVQDAAVAGITGTNDRGVRPDTLSQPGSLGVLRDDRLGNTAAFHPVRSAYMEMEFITNRDVDNLFNVNANRETFKNDLAARLAEAIIADMEAQP